jgi:CheY-like chemotaxis protein
MFTDVVMPGKNGRQLAEEARAMRPDLAVLFTTGYTRNAIVHHGILDAGVHVLTKPHTLEALSQKVSELLRAATKSS